MRVTVPWQLRPVPPEALEAARQCELSHGFPPWLQRIIAQRGFCDSEAISRFLRPRLDHLSDPFLLPMMRAAVDRLLKAVDGQEKVVLYGDYDVDGVTSLSILSQVLAAYGLKVRTFLPHRMDEGYGLSHEGLQRCLAEGRPDLLVAVDCGTGSAVEVAWLTEQGIDTIVLDHHECPPAGPPKCAAVVNPKLGDQFHYLCSAGLAFKVGHALLKTRPVPGFDLRETLDLVALGTVADVVPLVAENRLLVHRGLRYLEQTRRPGLLALKRLASLNGNIKSQDIGFRIGPRLNASGRLDTAQASLDLLLTDDHAKAEALARALDLQNRDRQNVQARVEAEAEAALRAQGLVPGDDAPVVVIGADAWHPGVVGIVAGKLSRRYGVPAVVVAFDGEGMGKGSGRSIPGISLVQGLNACRDILHKGGGHDMAVGLSVEKARFSAFRDRLAAAIREQWESGGASAPLWVDAEVALADLDFETLEFLEALEPFGQEHPAPVLWVRGVTAAGDPQLLKEKHRRIVLDHRGTRLTAMWFESAHRRLPPPPWDVALTIQRGEWRGEERLEVLIADLRAAVP